MEGTHLPLNIWYLGMYLMLSTAKPISAMSLHRQTGIQYHTCWRLLHRLRAMMDGGVTLPLSGIIPQKVAAPESALNAARRRKQRAPPDGRTEGRNSKASCQETLEIKGLAT
jgi:hypothetical protein